MLCKTSLQVGPWSDCAMTMLPTRPETTLALASLDSSFVFEVYFSTSPSRGHASSEGSDLHVAFVLSIARISTCGSLLAS